jgi:TRAP-type mannitol/chloroaromatic compound transport system permease small subunit
VTESSLVALSRRLDAPSRLIGRWFRWLAVALVLVQLVVVVARYVFAYSNPMLQEAVLYTNATLFMACAGYAYWIDAHVRVDITYFSASARSRAVIDLAGIVFGLVPMCLALAWFGWPYVRASWAALEGPLFFGGIPAVYLLKTLILVFPALLVLQAMAVTLRAVAVLRGAEVDLFERNDPGRAP